MIQQVKKEIVIYRLEFPNGKNYIGQTRNFKGRMAVHRNHADTARAIIHRAIAKYKWQNVKRHIITEVTAPEADATELMYQILWQSHITQNGYNSVYGGNSNKRLSENHKSKIRKSITGIKHPKKDLTHYLKRYTTSEYI